MHYATGVYAGPKTMWDGGTKEGTGNQSGGNGFLVQSTDKDDYGKNFPTTGANNLYFYLDIAGVSTALDWPEVTVGTYPNAITAKMSDITTTSVKVTLTGPVSNGMTAPAPPTLPAEFELIGKTGSTEIVKYGFKLQKWYVHRGNVFDIVNGHTQWCVGLGGGYEQTKLADLTSAEGSVEISSITYNFPSATPKNPNGNYYCVTLAVVYLVNGVSLQNIPTLALITST